MGLKEIVSTIFLFSQIALGVILKTVSLNWGRSLLIEWKHVEQRMYR